MFPAYYVPYEQGLPQIKERALPASELERRHPQSKPLLASAAAQLLCNGRIETRAIESTDPRWRASGENGF